MEEMRYPEPPSAPGDDCTVELAILLAQRDEEIAKLRAALVSIPAIAEEIRQKWDEGMRAGKLLIALIDPKLEYRADITAIHQAIAGHPAKAS